MLGKATTGGSGFATPLRRSLTFFQSVYIIWNISKAYISNGDTTVDKQAEAAFDRLKQRFLQARGSEGAATDAEATEMAIECISALGDYISDEELNRTLNDLRSRQARFQRVAGAIQRWQNRERDSQKTEEFKRFVAYLYDRVNPLRDDRIGGTSG